MRPPAIAKRLAEFLPAELRRARRTLRRAKTRHVDTAVHDVRKSIKRLRAALRLAEGMAPGQKIDAVENALRDAAHALGPLRDHLVLEEIGRALAKNRRNSPAPPESPSAAPMLKRASVRLRIAAGSLSRLIEAGFDEDGVEAGLRRLYKKAVHQMENARKSESDEDLHAWRRRTKDLLYVLELIAAPARLVKKFDKLAKQLGDDHDLAVFIAHHNSTQGKESHGKLLARAEKRRSPLQKKAFKLGEEIFADNARKFARNVVG